MRLLGFALLALAAIWFGFVDNDWLDRRPVQRLLFLGHSQTYYNDMPKMVAEMADSADSPIRYDVTMQAFANATLEDHWRNRKTRQLLSRGGWHRLIVHSEGGLQPQDPTSSMQVHGIKLLAATKTVAPPMLVIDHSPTEAFYARRNYSGTRSEYAGNEQENVRNLAMAAGADVIDVASIWDQVRAQDLPFSLYKDGNHPSLQGSYLIALVIYAKLSGDDVTNVTYVPWRMSGEDAELLRNKVQAALAGY
jgi:hypothetical protein